MSETGKRVDPYRNFNYVLEIDDIEQAGFSECTVGGATTDPIEYREGNENPKTNPKTARKLHGMVKYDNISLKWGVTDQSQELYDWFKGVTDGPDDRRSGAIVQLDLEGNEKSRWEFINAWPTKYTAPTFNATANEVSIETLELAHEGLTRTE
ncbi:MAG: phage tail protein [Planctomycetota bacterium]